MRKVLWLPMLLLLASFLSLPGRPRPSPSQTAYDRLKAVEAWDMTLDVEYRFQTKEDSVRAITSWSGRLPRVPSTDDHYTGRARITGSGQKEFLAQDGEVVHVRGGGTVEDWAPTLQIHPDHYEFGLGSMDMPATQSDGRPGTISYSGSVEVHSPLPAQGLRLTGSGTFTRQSPYCQDMHEPETIIMSWTFAPVGEQPVLEAVPTVPASITRGEQLSLDGSKSTGKIREYRWTFQPGGSGANPKAEKRGVTAAIVPLDSLQVTLTVVGQDQKTDRKTVSVQVTPRPEFRTHFEEMTQQGYLTDCDPPICLRAGTDGQGKPMYEARWVGAENVCAFDPPASSKESSHILHPRLEGAGPDDLFVLKKVSDPGGPWDGFYYFKEWKVEIKRKILVNPYIVQSAPPLAAYGNLNFYEQNLKTAGTDVVGYLKGVRDHEKKHSLLMAEALQSDDPARRFEPKIGKDDKKLRSEAMDSLRRAAEFIHQKAKDPLNPSSWDGFLAVPQSVDQPQGGTWRTLYTKVGGDGYGSF